VFYVREADEADTLKEFSENSTFQNNLKTETECL